jgi:hypothetical protein
MFLFPKATTFTAQSVQRQVTCSIPNRNNVILYPASYPVRIRGTFLWGKEVVDVKLAIRFNLVPRTRTVGLYILPYSLGGYGV